MHNELPTTQPSTARRAARREIQPGDRVKFAKHDRVYIMGDHGELRRAVPKVKGKRARAQDREARRQQRAAQARAALVQAGTPDTAEPSS